MVEAAGGGSDTIISSISFDLSTHGANVEDLILTGSAVTGTGNALDNTIQGDSLANTLSGGAGNDTLTGGGNDTLVGGTGNDTFNVSAGDTVVETAGEGIDTVNSYLTSYTLGANLENLTFAVGASAGVTGTQLTLRSRSLSPCLRTAATWRHRSTE